MKHKYVIVLEEQDIAKLFNVPAGQRMSIETMKPGSDYIVGDKTRHNIEVKFTLEQDDASEQTKA